MMLYISITCIVLCVVVIIRSKRPAFQRKPFVVGLIAVAVGLATLVGGVDASDTKTVISGILLVGCGQMAGFIQINRMFRR